MGKFNEPPRAPNKNPAETWIPNLHELLLVYTFYLLLAVDSKVFFIDNLIL